MIVLKAAQEKLLTALQSVAGIVERRHTLPILANVLLRKNGANVEFTRYNGQTPLCSAAQDLPKVIAVGSQYVPNRAIRARV